MNTHAVRSIVVLIGLVATAGHAIGADAEQLSRDVANRTEMVLNDINEALSQRIAQDLTRPLAEQVERPALRPVSRAPHSGLDRRTVTLSR